VKKTTKKSKWHKLFGVHNQEMDNTDSICTTAIKSTYFSAPQADSTQIIDGVQFTPKASESATRKISRDINLLEINI